MFLSLLLSGFFTFVELNCENLFDYLHDEGKQDVEYLPESTRHWTKKRYWRKLNNIAQELLSCSEEGIPDMIALCEVENDSVMRDLTKRSLLRHAGYEYLMTCSPDQRGIDVSASLYIQVIGDIKQRRHNQPCWIDTQITALEEVFQRGLLCPRIP